MKYKELKTVTFTAENVANILKAKVETKKPNFFLALNVAYL